MRAEVFIPTFRGSTLLPRALDALGEGWRRRCVVIDNASTDGTTALLAERYPDVRALRLPTNQGFGKAINAAVKRSEAELVVVLNDDVVCERGALDALTEAFGRFDVGMVSGVLVEHGSGRVESVGLTCDPSLAAHDLKAATGGLLVGPSGGLAAYRRRAFDDAGGFDPGFFAYYEDLDLALRLAAMGWRAEVAKDARAVHLGSASSGWRSREKAELVGYSRGRMIRKYGVGTRLGAIPWLLLELGAALMLALELRTPAPLSRRVRGFAECSERLPYPHVAAGRMSLAAAARKRVSRRFGRRA